MKTVLLFWVCILGITILLPAQTPPLPADNLPRAEIGQDTEQKLDALQQQLPPASNPRRREEIRRYLQQALEAYEQVLVQKQSKQDQPAAPEMSQQDRQKIQIYLKQALAHYDKTLADNAPRQRLAIPPRRETEKSLQPVTAPSSPSTALPSESKEQKVRKYIGEALDNYAKATAKPAVADPKLDQQKQEKIRQYLDEALRNYEEILQRQKNDERPQQTKATPDLDAEKQKKIRQYLDQALQNYEEILRQQRQRERQWKR